MSLVLAAGTRQADIWQEITQGYGSNGNEQGIEQGASERVNRFGGKHVCRSGVMLQQG